MEGPLALFEKLSNLSGTISIFDFDVTNLPSSASSASASNVTQLARTMIEPTGHVTEAAPGAEYGPETGPESGPETVSTGFLVELGIEQGIEVGIGSSVEAGVETFTEVAPGQMVETMSGLEEIAPGSCVEIDPGFFVEVAPGLFLEASPGAEVSVVPQTTREINQAFMVEIAAGAAVEIAGGQQVALAAGSVVELADGSMIETVPGGQAEVAAGQMAELAQGHVEAAAGAEILAADGNEVPANYVMVETAPNSEFRVASGTEVEVVVSAEFAQDELMPGSLAEAEVFSELEVLPGSLEKVGNEFMLTVTPESDFEVAPGSTATDDTHRFVEVYGGSAIAARGNETVLWAGTMVKAMAWWQKLTAKPVSGKEAIPYSTGLVTSGQEKVFGRSIEAAGLGGIALKLSASFTSSTGKSHTIAIEPGSQSSAAHCKSGTYDVWQLVVAFQNDSGACLTQHIAPDKVPFLLV
jgi:hypothetical protein